jgi:hypothetical protein
MRTAPIASYLDPWHRGSHCGSSSGCLLPILNHQTTLHRPQHFKQGPLMICPSFGREE